MLLAKFDMVDSNSMSKYFAILLAKFGSDITSIQGDSIFHFDSVIECKEWGYYFLSLL